MGRVRGMVLFNSCAECIDKALLHGVEVIGARNGGKIGCSTPVELSPIHLAQVPVWLTRWDLGRWERKADNSGKVITGKMAM